MKNFRNLFLVVLLATGCGDADSKKSDKTASCVTRPDCRANEICSSGVCEEGNVCVTKADCGLGQTCNGGVCSDLYAACILDPNSQDAAVAACGRNDSSMRGCIVDDYIACDTGTCGRNDGSNPFCTNLCRNDAECGEEGECVEFGFGTNEKYCAQK